MDSKEFVRIRKKLAKTQKEIAVLLGTSLKAVSSYEQGWRGVPVHVERQMLLLLSRKQCMLPGKNCWEIRNCSEKVRNKCPAWEFQAGRMCWFITGTQCNSEVKENWQEKLAVCRKCGVMQSFE